jgi:hypothetical protein
MQHSNSHSIILSTGKGGLHRKRPEGHELSEEHAELFLFGLDERAQPLIVKFDALQEKFSKVEPVS